MKVKNKPSSIMLIGAITGILIGLAIGFVLKSSLIGIVVSITLGIIFGAATEERYGSNQSKD